MKIILLFFLMVCTSCVTTQPKEMFLANDNTLVEEQAIILDPHNEIISIDGKKINSIMYTKFDERYYALYLEPGAHRISKRIYVGYNELSVISYEITIEKGFTYYCYSIQNENALKYLKCYQGPDGFKHPKSKDITSDALLNAATEIMKNKKPVNIKLINCSSMINNMGVGYYYEDHLHKALNECLSLVPKT